MSGLQDAMLRTDQLKAMHAKKGKDKKKGPRRFKDIKMPKHSLSDIKVPRMELSKMEGPGGLAEVKMEIPRLRDIK